MKTQDAWKELIEWLESLSQYSPIYSSDVLRKIEQLEDKHE